MCPSTCRSFFVHQRVDLRNLHKSPHGGVVGRPSRSRRAPRLRLRPCCGDWWRFRASAAPLQRRATCGRVAGEGARAASPQARLTACGLRKSGGQGRRTHVSVDRSFILRPPVRRLTEPPQIAVRRRRWASSSSAARASAAAASLLRRLVQVPCVCAAAAAACDLRARGGGAPGAGARRGRSRFGRLQLAKSGTFPLSRTGCLSMRDENRRSEACAILAYSAEIPTN